MMGSAMAVVGTKARTEDDGRRGRRRNRFTTLYEVLLAIKERESRSGGQQGTCHSG